MNISELKYFRYKLNFNSNFTNSKFSFESKNIIVIQLTDKLGNKFYGECTTLPGLYENEIPAMENLLEKIKRHFTNTGIHNINLAELYNDLEKFPPLLFGLDQAVFNFKINYNLPLEILSGFPDGPVSVNAVTGINNLEMVLREIAEFYNKGYRSFKIKLGRENFDDDYKLLKKIQKIYGNDIRIRVDINGKWNFENAKNNIEQLSEFKIEFVEQPVSNKNDLIALTKNSNLNIAADESIRNLHEAENFIEEGKIKFLVLKPALLGKISGIFSIIKTAKEKNINIIISSSFESSVGRSILPLFALPAQKNYAHGLATGNIFSNDFPIPSYKVTNGVINFNITKYKNLISGQSKIDIL